jgi:NTE family protein
MPNDRQSRSTSPVSSDAAASGHDDPLSPEPGIALCLSGGGYRAMLFHLGALWRLNDLGFLPKLARVSSVSGGSITAGVLGLKWGSLGFDQAGIGRGFDAEVVAPVRHMAATTVDESSIFSGLLTPGSVADHVVGAYQKHLFGDATLQDLPHHGVRFVINATNVQTGSLFRFSQPYIADYRLGRINAPATPLAVAVAASSAFPPVLSPLVMEFDEGQWIRTGAGGEDCHSAPYLTKVYLTDGGVYDNLGLETAWKRYDTILVSNGGGRMAPDPEPDTDWVRHGLRINELIDHQVRNLRARQVIDAFETGDRKGAYWGIRTDIAQYGLPDTLPCPADRTMVLAQTKTRLKKLESTDQERLINWGYAACDAAMRRFVVSAAPAPTQFPYPGAGV